MIYLDASACGDGGLGCDADRTTITGTTNFGSGGGALDFPMPTRKRTTTQPPALSIRYLGNAVEFMLEFLQTPPA
jgi:hypothetical protein